MYNIVVDIFPSEVRPWHEDEEDAEAHGDGCEDQERHHRSRHEELLDEWLADARPVHEGVFTEAEGCHDQVELVLVADKEVCAEGER